MATTPNREQMILLPAGGSNNNCFCCSPTNEAGLKMRFYTTPEQDKVYSWIHLPPRFCGWKNIAHGGIVATLCDEVMAYGAMVVLRKFVLSKSVSVDFIKPVQLETELRLEAWVESVNSEREAVLASAIYNSDNEVVSKGSCVAATFTIEGLRKMGVTDDTMLTEFDEMINGWRR